jgi:hypothetical protein
MTPEAFDWSELGSLAERHKALASAKEALSPELFREVEDWWNSVAPGETFDVRRAVGLLLKVAKDETGRAENAALGLLLDWGRPRMPELIEVREQRWEKLKEVLNAVEAYWTETAPWGKGFAVENGLELLVYDLRRYQAAVARIFEKEQEQKALLDHKTATGQEAEADRQRWLAYLEMTHAITAALSMKPSNEETTRNG